MIIFSDYKKRKKISKRAKHMKKLGKINDLVRKILSIRKKISIPVKQKMIKMFRKSR